MLKGDRSFLPLRNDDPENPQSIMFRHVIAMAKELGLTCIAEGVETQSQVEILRDSRCALAQGYFFDEPLPSEAFADRLSGFRYPLSKAEAAE